MSTTLRIRYALDIGGQPYPFANPFTLPSISCAPVPAIYNLLVPIETTAVVWDGTTPITTLDIFVVQSDVNVDLEIVVGSNTQRFTLPVLAGGWPTIVPGGLCYAGQTGSQDSFVYGTLTAITKLNVHNPSITNAAQVGVLIAKVA